MSEVNLSETSLAFLDIIAHKKYELLSFEKTFPITVVNQSAVLQKMMKEHSLALGLKDFFLVELNTPLNTQYKNLQKIFVKRKSNRKYEKLVSYQELCNLLVSTYQIDENGKRNLASGGGIYPVELFILNSKINEIPKGIFYYNLYLKRLELIQEMSEESISELVKNTFISNLKQDMEYHKASAFVFPIALINKASFKYGDLAIKLALMDGGAITQNLYLSAACINLKVSACAGFVENPIKEILGFKRVYQHIITSILIGK